MQSPQSEENYDTFARPGDPDFTSFPKHLSEDTISYWIYLVPPSFKNESQIRSRLTDVLKAANTLTKSLLKDYIWQRDSFALSLSSPSTVPGSNNSLTSSYLYGRTEFGESIADEWVVVYILREISKQFKDAWVRVEDDDGEFLLVEAANALPKWLNPEIASNRVWIQNGRVRIIPRDQPLSQNTKRNTKSSKKPQVSCISLSQALDFIKHHPDQLIDSADVQSDAFYRLRNFPAQISESMHTARIIIPRTLAYVLHATPAHISRAVEAFYIRDAISLRPLRSSENHLLHFPVQDLVTTSVRFTRVGYAQLRSQQFSPPEAWSGLVEGTNDSTIKGRAMMGMKITCGFEMLLADPQNQDKRAVREVRLLLDDVENGEESLPTDSELESWPQIDEDDGWLDVSFEDFEKELNGNAEATTGKDFGDKAAQENLRRIVESFQQFLEEDAVDADGSDSQDDMDFDDEDSDEGEATAEQDHDSTRDELLDRMRQMKAPSLSGNQDLAVESYGPGTRADSVSDQDDDTAIRELTEAFEAELAQAGALNLNPGQTGDVGQGEADPNYQLVKNMLEAFKSEGGRPGPAGTLLRSFGLNMPRDDDGKP